eukprot:1185875-Prorocentrum_minimum.AAC.2
MSAFMGGRPWGYPAAVAAAEDASSPLWQSSLNSTGIPGGVAPSCCDRTCGFWGIHVTSEMICITCSRSWPICLFTFPGKMGPLILQSRCCSPLLLPMWRHRKRCPTFSAKNCNSKLQLGLTNRCSPNTNIPNETHPLVLAGAGVPVLPQAHHLQCQFAFVAVGRGVEPTRPYA